MATARQNFSGRGVILGWHDAHMWVRNQCNRLHVLIIVFPGLSCCRGSFGRREGAANPRVAQQARGYVLADALSRAAARQDAVAGRG